MRKLLTISLYSLSSVVSLVVFINLIFISKVFALPACNSPEIDQTIQDLSKLEQGQLEELAQCGTSIVNPLINALNDQNLENAQDAAYMLSLIGPPAKAATQSLTQILLDINRSTAFRVRAAYALQLIQSGDRETITALLHVLSSAKNPDIRRAAASALATNSDAEKEVIETLIDIVLDRANEDLVQSASAFAIGDIAKTHQETVRPLVEKTLIQIVQDSQQSDQVVTACIYALDQIDATDKQAIDALTQVLNRNNLRIHIFSTTALADIVNQIYDQSTTINEINDKLPIVQDVQSVLHTLSTNNNSDIQNAIETVNSTVENFQLKRRTLIIETAQQWLIGNRAVWIIHPLFWLALIFAYPKSSRVQAIFFWNKYIREIFGLWYVSVLLTWVAPLRCRLFDPFKDSLLADAKLDSFDSQAFFSQSGVKLKDTNSIQSIQQVLPEIKGQTILEGESGLGKTMMLRHLVRQSKRITVYLPAQKCENGVIEAIQAKLHGQAQDADFLKKLIYSGAIDICIDGLNEVKPDVRANIKAFVESYFKGNIIMTTQPLLWNPPSTAKTYVLQPLHRNQIEQFLHLYEHRLPPDAKLHRTDYKKACTQFLTDALSEQSASDDSVATRRTLSNPMDLTIVAQMISSDVQPDLFHLQEQQYKLMAEDYDRSWNQPFPLKQFSEFVYQMRDQDEYAMTGESFYQALTIMEKEQHRMVLSRQWKDKDGNDKQEWSFRHDKILEFFVVQNFLSSGNEGAEKRKKHMSDPRFRGIYLLLAHLLPLSDALTLREDFIQYAADTQDHTVSDAYVQLMRSRC